MKSNKIIKIVVAITTLIHTLTYAAHYMVDIKASVSSMSASVYEEVVSDDNPNTWRQDIHHVYPVSDYLASKNCNYGNNPIFYENRIWSTEGNGQSLNLATTMKESGGLLFALSKLINYSGVDTKLNPGSLYFYSYYAKDANDKYYMKYDSDKGIKISYSSWVDFLSVCYSDVVFDERVTLSVGNSNTSSDNKLNSIISAMSEGKYVIVEIKADKVKRYDWETNSVVTGIPQNHFVLLTGVDTSKNISMDDSLTSSDKLNDVYSIDDIVAYNTFIVNGNHKSTLPYYSKNAEIPWNLILINKDHEITKDYIASVNTAVSSLLTNSGKASGNSYERNEVDSRIISDMEAMANEMQEDGIKIYCQSGMRSYDYQNSLFSSYFNLYGEEHANMYSARPGKSEHNAGLAMDFGAIDNNNSYVSTEVSFENTNAYDWLCKNAYNYGFILRYPKGDTAIAKTGYGYEPWHWRYVGKEYATKFVEYVGGDKVDDEHIHAYSNSGYNGKTYEDFYDEIIVPDYSTDSDTKENNESDKYASNTEEDLTKYSDETPRRLYYFLRHPIKSLGNLSVGLCQRIYIKAAVGSQAVLSNSEWFIVIFEKYNILKWYIILSMGVSSVGIVVYLLKIVFSNDSKSWNKFSKGILYMVFGTVAPLLATVCITSTLNKITNKILSNYEERLLITEIGTNLVELSNGELDKEKEKAKEKLIVIVDSDESDDSDSSVSNAERIYDNALLTPAECKTQDLRCFYPLTAKDIEDVISKKSPNCYWKGKGYMFIQASRVSGIDPRFLFALCIVEAGWNPINRHMSKHNYYSINMPDNNLNGGIDFGKTDEEGIINSCIWIADRYIYHEDRKQYTIAEMAFPTSPAAQGHSYNNTGNWDSPANPSSVPSIMAYFPVKSNYDTSSLFNTGKSSSFQGSGEYAGKIFNSTTPDGKKNQNVENSNKTAKDVKVYKSTGEYQLWLDDKLEKDIFKESTKDSYKSITINFKVNGESKEINIKDLLNLTSDDLKNLNYSFINEDGNDYAVFEPLDNYTLTDIHEFSDDTKINNYLYYSKDQFIPVHYNMYKDTVFWYFYDYIKYQYIRYSAIKDPNSFLKNYTLPKGDYLPEDFGELYAITDSYNSNSEETPEQYKKRLEELESYINSNSSGYVSMMCDYKYTHYNEYINDLFGLSYLFNFTEVEDCGTYHLTSLYTKTNDIKSWAKAQSYNYNIKMPDFDEFDGNVSNVPPLSGVVLGEDWSEYAKNFTTSNNLLLKNKYLFSPEVIDADKFDLSTKINSTEFERLPWRVYASEGKLNSIGEKATPFERKLCTLNNNIYKRVSNLTRNAHGELNDNQLILINAIIATEEYNKMFSQDIQPRSITMNSVDIDKILRVSYSNSLSDIIKNPDTLYMIYENSGFINVLIITITSIFIIINNVTRVILMSIIFIMIAINTLVFAFFNKELRSEALKGAVLQCLGLLFNFVAILSVLMLNTVLQDICSVALVSIVYSLIMCILVILVTCLNIALLFAVSKDAINYGGSYVSNLYTAKKSQVMAASLAIKSEMLNLKKTLGIGKFTDKEEETDVNNTQEIRRMHNIELLNDTNNLDDDSTVVEFKDS